MDVDDLKVSLFQGCVRELLKTRELIDESDRDALIYAIGLKASFADNNVDTIEEICQRTINLFDDIFYVSPCESKHSDADNFRKLH